MERNTFFCNLGLYIKSVLVLILLLGGSGSAWADDLTINNETATDALVPIAGSAANKNPNQPESEFIVSSTSISSLGGKEITKLTFYLETSATVENWGTAEFEVLLKEVSNEYYPSEYSYLGTDGTIVYSGQLDATGSTMDIQFSTPFTYSGDKHLLIRINCTKSGTSSSVKFYGIKPDTKNIRALYKSASAAYRSYFNPKTTFTYQDPASGGIPKPTAFTASSVTYNSATLSWKEKGEATQWQIKYKAGADFTNLNSDSEGDSILVTTSTEGYSESDGVISYILPSSTLTQNTTYYAYVRAYIDEDNQSDWSSKITFATPEQYPTPTGLTASNYAGDGDNATLSWTNGAGTTPESWKLRYHTADFNPANNEGTLVEDIESNSYPLTGLTPGQVYYVSVQACYVGDNESNWTSTISFTPIQAWETFESGISDSWYNQNNNWKTNQSGYTGKAYSPSSGYELRTPRLYATAGQTINFEVTGSPTIKVYKNSRVSYTTLTSGATSYTAPTDGYYWLSFSGYKVAIDNIYGFTPASNENLMELGTRTMSTSGTVGGDYTAKVPLRELGGNTETYTAQLYYDGVKVAEIEDATIDGNRDANVELTFTPSEAKTSKPMYIKIIYNDGESELTTPTTNVTMSTTDYIFDEKGTKPGSYFTNKVAQLKYTAKHGWNTICVPFYLNDTYLEQIFGEGCVVYIIDSYNEGVLSFTKKTSNYSCSTPYLVYTENEDKVATNIYLKGVTYLQSYEESSNITQTKGDASFIGTFAPMAAGSLTGKYGITNEGKLGKGSDKATIKGYRAYIAITGPAPSRLSIAINDDTTTDLGFVRLIDKEAKDIYNLQGQKVKKAGKGIYVVNGRKVIIK